MAKVRKRLTTYQVDLDPIEITGYEITTLRLANQLEPGKFYRVTDFQTVHRLLNPTTIIRGNLEHILVLATSGSSLSKRCGSFNFPQDELEIDWTSTVAEDGTTPRAGWIVYRRDTVRNVECYFDYRNVKVRRWQFNGFDHEMGFVETTPSNITLTLTWSANMSSTYLSRYRKWEIRFPAGFTHAAGPINLTITKGAFSHTRPLVRKTTMLNDWAANELASKFGPIVYSPALNAYILMDIYDVGSSQNGYFIARTNVAYTVGNGLRILPGAAYNDYLTFNGLDPTETYLGPSCTNNFFIGQCNFVRVGSTCSNNTIVGSTHNSQLGSESHNNLFLGSVQWCDMGVEQTTNVFDNTTYTHLPSNVVNSSILPAIGSFHLTIEKGAVVSAFTLFALGWGSRFSGYRLSDSFVGLAGGQTSDVVFTKSIITSIVGYFNGDGLTFDRAFISEYLHIKPTRVNNLDSLNINTLKTAVGVTEVLTVDEFGNVNKSPASGIGAVDANAVHYTPDVKTDPEKAQARLNIGITLAPTQIGYGDAVGAIKGDEGFTFDETTQALSIGKTGIYGKIRMIRGTAGTSGGTVGFIYEDNNSLGINNSSGGGWVLLRSNNGPVVISNNTSTANETWRFTPQGNLEATLRDQTIRSMVGSLTVGSTASSNADLMLTAGGTGRVKIISTIDNAAGNFATFSAGGAFQQRTPAQVRTDIGAMAGSGLINQVGYFNPDNILKGDASFLFFEGASPRLEVPKIAVANGTAALPSISFISNPNTGFYLAGADTVGISAGGLFAMTLSPKIIDIPSTISLQAKGGITNANFAEQPINMGPILTFTLTNGGSGYVDGTYTDVQLTSVGTTAYGLFDITVTGGVVTNAVLKHPGFKYLVNAEYTISNTLLGGTGSGLIITVNTVLGSDILIFRQGAPLFRLENGITNMNAGQAIGQIMFTDRDASPKASGDKVALIAKAVSASGGGYFDIETSAPGVSARVLSLSIGHDGTAIPTRATIGGTTIRPDVRLSIIGNITGGTYAYGTFADLTVQADVTNSARGFQTDIKTVASPFTVSTIYHYYAQQNAFGVGSSVGTQVGFQVSSNLTGGTLNYAFRGDLALATGRWNLYMQGTANNYLSGSLGIGVQVPTVKLDVKGGIKVTAEIQSKLPTNSTNIGLYEGDTSVLAWGINVQDSGFNFALRRYGGLGDLNMLFISRTADAGYFWGRLSIGGSALSTTANLRIIGDITGGVTSYGTYAQQIVKATVTTAARVFQSEPSTEAVAFTLPLLEHFSAVQGTIGAGSSVTTQIGFHVESSMVGAATNYGFRGAIPAAANRWNLYMDGTAQNHLAGNLLIGNTDGTDKLDVNGTARVRTIANATGNFVTLSATGVLQQRTAEEVRADIGAAPALANILGFNPDETQFLAHNESGVFSWITIT